MAVWPSSLLRVGTVAENTIAAHFHKPSGFTYRPGQTVSVVLPSVTSNAKELRHIFSLVSAPHENELCITTRVRPGSAFKQALTELSDGAPLSIVGPYGYFTPQRADGNPLVFIAGGVGIAPFMSMLRDHVHRHSERPIRLVYSNRQAETAPFLDELYALQKSASNVRLTLTMTGTAHSSWTGQRGRINDEMLVEALGGLNAPTCFVAGTEQMVTAIKAQLARIGTPRDSVYNEVFYGYESRQG